MRAWPPLTPIPKRTLRMRLSRKVTRSAPMSTPSEARSSHCVTPHAEASGTEKRSLRSITMSEAGPKKLWSCTATIVVCCNGEANEGLTERPRRTQRCAASIVTPDRRGVWPRCAAMVIGAVL
jgi:hypothetical protein